MLELLNYTFFQHALWGSLLASIACGIIGTYIVTRRLVFISGGITHASFGGIGIGLYTGISPILSAAIGILCLLPESDYLYCFRQGICPFPTDSGGALRIYTDHVHSPYHRGLLANDRHRISHFLAYPSANDGQSVHP